MKLAALLCATIPISFSVSSKSLLTDSTFFYRAGLGLGGSAIYGRGKEYNLNEGIHLELGTKIPTGESTYNVVIGRQFNSGLSAFFQPHTLSSYFSVNRVVSLNDSFEVGFGPKFVMQNNFEVGEGGAELVEFEPSFGLQGSMRYKITNDDLIVVRASMISYEVDKSTSLDYERGDTFNGSGLELLFQKKF